MFPSMTRESGPNESIRDARNAPGHMVVDDKAVRTGTATMFHEEDGFRSDTASRAPSALRSLGP